MKQDLQNDIDQWSSPSLIRETRSITEQPGPIAQAELLLTLRMSVVVTVGLKSQTIATRGLFHTIANGNEAVNSPQDCYRFNRIASRFETEFFNEYERIVDLLLNDQYGNVR